MLYIITTYKHMTWDIYKLQTADIVKAVLTTTIGY